MRITPATTEWNGSASWSQRSDEFDHCLRCLVQALLPGALGLSARLEAVLPVLDPDQADGGGKPVSGDLLRFAEGVAGALTNKAI